MSLAGIDRVDDRAQPDRRRQRHLDDDPVNTRVLVERPDLLDDAGLGCLALDLDEAGIDAHLPAEPQDLLEVDGGRSVLADDHDRQRRRPTVIGQVRAGLRHGPADLFGDGGTLEQAGALGGHGQAPSGADGVARLAAHDGFARLEDESLDLLEQLLDPRRGRALELAVPDRREIDHDVRGCPARRGLTEEGGHVQVARRVDVAATGERLCGADELEACLDARQRDLGRGTRRRPHLHRPRRALRVRFLGELERGREPGIRRRVLIGQLQEPTVQAATGRGGPGVQFRVLRIARASFGQRRDHRDKRRAETGGDRRCAATAGDGLGRGEAIDEGAQGQVGERRSRGFVHPLIVGGGRRPGTAGVMPRPERASATGAGAVPARPLPRSDVAGVAGERPAAGRNVRSELAPCQAARA